MKKRLFLLPVLASLLAGCAVDLSFNAGKDLSPNITKGTLGDFSLVAPAANSIVHDLPTFSWTESANALNYTLEVCSTDSFDPTSSSVVYARETNIVSTSFKLSANLGKKNTTYYWRVTAVNEYNSRSVGKEKQSSVSTFIYNVDSLGEIDIGVGDKSDWALHEVGSYADISIDETDFFGTGDKDSLKITFEKENTSQGPGHEKSDGWLSVQKAAELDLYDCDAFFCNFYYSGHDSTILIRIIDQDGELWYKYVKFTMDTRQLILLRFDDFVLRTLDTVVQNQVFDHEHIQALEVCFEQTFGDGCCIVGGIKAVSYDDYSALFIKDFNFNLIPETNWVNESYNFKKTVSDDGSELKLEYSTEPGFNGNTKGMNNYGYGFAKIPVERYFSDGNAVSVKVKYEGYLTDKVNAIIRLYEPDRDRWSYTQPYKTLSGEYIELTIPFMAFEQSSIQEGKRQFYYISQIQFGLNNCYGTGSLYYKDFKIITLPSVSTNPKVVGNNGIIENFDEYVFRGEMYKSWESTTNNKDEGMFIEKDVMFHDGSNVNAGKFTYKTDMSMAAYDTYTDVQVEDLNAIKFWIKDASVPNTEVPTFADYTGDDVRPLVVIQIVLKDGRWYRYNIDKAPRKWTEYTVKFTDFYLYDGHVYESSTEVLSQYVVNFAFGMQYFYKFNNNPYPLYTQNNPVYMDNIMFTNADETSTRYLENELHPDANTKTLVDDFEYASTDTLSLHWFPTGDKEYENIELSDDVSSEGNEHSMKLDYQKGKDSPAYATFPLIGSDVESKGMILDIKGDGVATVYINLYLSAGNNTFKKYRATLSKPANSWKRYQLGFSSDIFAPQDGGATLGKSSMQKLYKIVIGMSGGSDGSTSSIYIDNISLKFDDVNYSDNIITPIV